jgi:hypothetical protein
METCTVEVGLLRKKPCGNPGLTHCANCEMPLCKDHAVAQVNSMNNKTGKFMCKECNAAHKEFEKSAAAAAPPKKEGAAPAAPAAKPAQPAAKPAPATAAAAAKTAAPKPAAPAAAPAKKPDDDAPLEFTPSKPPAPKK